MSQIIPFISSAVAAGEESELLVGINNQGESLLSILMLSFSVLSILSIQLTILAKLVNHGMTLWPNALLMFFLLRSICCAV